MAGKYGCPWTDIICLQSCGCCNKCKIANDPENKYCPPNCACGIWKNNRGKPEKESSEEKQKRLDCHVGNGVNGWNCFTDCAFWDGEKCTNYEA